jgi:hypothetical protein
VPFGYRYAIVAVPAATAAADGTSS